MEPKWFKIISKTEEDECELPEVNKKTFFNKDNNKRRWEDDANEGMRQR